MKNFRLLVFTALLLTLSIAAVAGFRGAASVDVQRLDSVVIGRARITTTRWGALIVITHLNDGEPSASFYVSAIFAGPEERLLGVHTNNARGRGTSRFSASIPSSIGSEVAVELRYRKFGTTTHQCYTQQVTVERK